MKKLLVLILLIFSYSIYAQDEILNEYPLEEIKVDGLKINTNIFTSPVRVTIIDRKKIETFNGSSVADILKHTSGFYIRSYGGGLSLQTLSHNGLSSEQTLVLIDGQKINSNQNSTVDLSLLHSDNIERIEIINSGASSIYGSEAISGVINIVTRSPYTENKISINANVESGSYGTERFSSNFRSSVDNFYYSGSISREYSKNDFEYFYFNGIENILKRRLHADYRSDAVEVKTLYNYSGNTLLQLSGRYSNTNRNLPGIESGNIPSNSNQSDEELNFNLSFTHSNFFSQLFFRNHLMKYGVVNIINDHYKNSEVMSLSHLRLGNTVLGMETGISSLSGSNITENPDRIKFSGFASSVINISENLKFFPSLRIDKFSDISEFKLTGKAGLNYKPFNSHDLHFRLNTGNNFRVPTFNDMYWIGAGNINLRPETSVNIDVGGIYAFKFFTDNILNVSYSYIDYRDRITWLPGSEGSWRPENIDRSISNIFSFTIESSLINSNSFSVMLNNGLTINNVFRISNDELNEKKLTYIPLEQFQTGLNMSMHGVSLNLFYSLVGKRYTDLQNKNVLPVTDILDGNVNYSFDLFRVNARFGFEVNNIFNNNYQLISGYPMPLRNYRVTLKINYN